MGMAVSFDVRDPHITRASLAEVLVWLHHVDATFSTYRHDSEISRFARGDIGVDELSDEVEEVLLRCVELTETTAGAFDAFVVPAPNGTHLDPSGFVKGWSIEHAARLLESIGATNFCINAGGDITVRGTPAPNTPWRVGIRHPDQPIMIHTIDCASLADETGEWIEVAWGPESDGATAQLADVVHNQPGSLASLAACCC